METVLIELHIEIYHKTVAVIKHVKGGTVIFSAYYLVSCFNSSF